MEDPDAAELVRNKLDDVYPRLADVAVGSVMAAVEEFPPDVQMSPHQLTKAFLATSTMTKDSLAARVIEARFTGRWRPACIALHRMLDDQSNARAGTKAAGRGGPHASASGDLTHLSDYDRDLLLHIAVQVDASLHGQTAANKQPRFDPSATFSLMCTDNSGFRVPTTGAYKRDAYSFAEGAELTTFAPIVARGSLEMLRTQKVGDLGYCPQDFAPEDMAVNLACHGRNGRSFGSLFPRVVDAGATADVEREWAIEDLRSRALHSPFRIQERYCSLTSTISVEAAVAPPALFPEQGGALFDTSEHNRYKINDLTVAYFERGEEDLLSNDYLDVALQSFVYVTSSAEASIRPGLHRLVDLAVFDQRDCMALPRINCVGSGRSPVYVNENLALDESPATIFVPGRAMIGRVRYHPDLQRLTNVSAVRSPFASVDGCSANDLVLVERPRQRATIHWLERIFLYGIPSPSPPPAPPGSPPPPPSPSAPSPSPSPPFYQGQTTLLAKVRGYQEELCASVYMLSSRARCERFAVQLSTREIYTAIPPPAAPPLDPSLGRLPAPPSLPPSPSIPSDMSNAPILATRLSTIRLPNEVPLPEDGTAQDHVLVSDGFYATSRAVVDIALADAPVGQRAACTSEERNNPLFCVTASVLAVCIDDLHACGDVRDNTDEPFVRLALRGTPSTRSKYLFGLRITLPETQELKDLFFESSEVAVGGGEGYSVRLRSPDGESVSCVQEQQTVDRTSGELLHICASAQPTQSEATALSHVEEVELALNGQLRQLWLRSVDVVERPLHLLEAFDVPAPPLPPPSPHRPPRPPQAPAFSRNETVLCNFESGAFPPDEVVVREEAGPCGLSPGACCDHALQHPYSHERAPSETLAFRISDAGCCDTLLLSTALRVPVVSPGFSTEAAGSGLLVI